MRWAVRKNWSVDGIEERRKVQRGEACEGIYSGDGVLVVQGSGTWDERRVPSLGIRCTKGKFATCDTMCSLSSVNSPPPPHTPISGVFMRLSL